MLSRCLINKELQKSERGYLIREELKIVRCFNVLGNRKRLQVFEQEVAC